jgi:predicted nucleotidyltransferase
MIDLKDNYNEFGLKVRDLDYLISTISDYKEVESAMIFGSRAKQTYKKGSDIDVALTGVNLTPGVVKEISVKLNEYLPIPFFVDVIDYTHLKKNTLKKHIDLFGKTIFEKEE